MRPAFAPGQSLATRIERFGRSREPIMVIDDIVSDPEALIDAATSAAFSSADEGRGGYPGIRASAPRGYVAGLVAALDPMIRRTFDLGDVVLSRAEGAFSIVTTPPPALHVMQRIPHIDISDPLRFALLHFLCGPPFEGTAFFRQDRTDYEQVRPEDFDAYRAARTRDLARLPPSSGYPDAVTPGYVETARFEARMNRLLVYRSFSIHSGIIPDSARLDADPRRGRLTANIFLTYARA